jgi:PAS domain S-box-containing protein
MGSMGVMQTGALQLRELLDRRTPDGGLSTEPCDGVVCTDAGGRIIEVNPVAGLLMGLEAVRLLGVPFGRVIRLVDEQTGQQEPDPVAACVRTGRRVETGNNALMVVKGGASLPIAGSAAPLRMARGALKGVIFVFRDATPIRIYQRRVLARAPGGTEPVPLHPGVPRPVPAPEID